MLINCVAYQEGKKLSDIPVEDISEYLKQPGCFVWVALRDPEALVSVVASLRRGSILVAFAGGLVLFGERHGWKKLPGVLGVLAGIALTLLG